MYRVIPLVLRVSAALLLLSLILWAGSSHTHTPSGVLQVFALSLFFFPGFLSVRWPALHRGQAGTPPARAAFCISA